MVSALVGLLKNAYEALPAKPAGLEGAVILQVSARAKQITIAVTDSGVGIPAEDLEEVRQPGQATATFDRAATHRYRCFSSIAPRRFP